MGVDEAGVNVHPPFGSVWLFLGRICLGCISCVSIEFTEREKVAEVCCARVCHGEFSDWDSIASSIW